MDNGFFTRYGCLTVNFQGDLHRTYGILKVVAQKFIDLAGTDAAEDEYRGHYAIRTKSDPFFHERDCEVVATVLYEGAGNFYHSVPVAICFHNPHDFYAAADKLFHRAVVMMQRVQIN